MVQWEFTLVLRSILSRSSFRASIANGGFEYTASGPQEFRSRMLLCEEGRESILP